MRTMRPGVLAAVLAATAGIPTAHEDARRSTPRARAPRPNGMRRGELREWDGKAKARRRRQLERGIIALVALLLLVPGAASCQRGTATVHVVDRSRLIVDVTPPTFTGAVGDTLTFRAVPRDTISGDTIAAVLLWSSSDSTGVRIDNNGHATLLRAGTYSIFADVARIVSMLIMRETDAGGWSEVYTVEREPTYAARGFAPDSLRLEVGESVPVCAYLEDELGAHYVADVAWSSSDPSVASVSGGGALCPPWNPGFPFPTPAMNLPRGFNLEHYLRGSRRAG
jgi:hypothetical protein